MTPPEPENSPLLSDELIESQSAEPVEAKEAERPPFFQWFGWSLVILIVATMVGSSVNSWLTEKPSTTTDFSQQRTTLYVAFATDVRNSIATGSGDASSNTAKEQFETALKDMRVGLLPKTTTEPEAARLVLLIDRELGRESEATALTTLRESKSEADKAFADIYDDPQATGNLEKAKEAEIGFTKTLLDIQAREARGEAGVRDSSLPKTRFMLTLLVLGAAGMAVCFGVIAAAYALYLIGTDKFPLAYGPLRPRDAEGAGHLAFRFAIFLVTLMLGVPLIAMGLEPLRMSESVVTMLSLMAVIGINLALLSFPLGLDAITPRQILGETKPLAKLVGVGVFGYLANIPFAIGFMLLGLQLTKGLPTPSHPIQDLLGPGTSIASMVSLFITAAILAPIGEEIGFRALLLGALRHRFAPIATALINGFIFASIHPQGPAMWLALMSVGTAASFLSLSTRSLIPCIVLHACHNGAIMVLAFLLAG